MTSDIVAKAMKHIKYGRSDCMSELKSDHLLYGPDVLLHKITCLFNIMIRHGYSSFNMKCSIIHIISIVGDQVMTQKAFEV